MRFPRSRVLWQAAWLLLVCVAPVSTFAQEDLSSESSAAEQREKLIMERFLSILERRPRRGAALDRVYGYHVERGTLEAFVDSLRKRAEDDPDDGAAPMLIGMFEAQRRRDAEAAKAFREAEKRTPDEPLASYYLGKSLVMVGRPGEAVEAFERALAKKPLRSDLLEIFQALGRVHQRARHDDEASDVWSRLEGLFPDDIRVQEEIASIVAEEGDHEGALARYEKLAGKATDEYRRVLFGVRAAELKNRVGRTDEAIDDFERLLSQLKPESWLHRDVRQRIEGVFLRTNDYDGLTKYYQRWLEKHPDDIDAMARAARSLAMQGRAPEAMKIYRDAIEKAPSNVRLRESLVEHLLRQQKFADAAKEFQQLAGIDPNNPEHLRRWGEVVLMDDSLPEAERKVEAAKVWNRLVDAKPDDAVTAAQVADLFRTAEMPEEALRLYAKAVELAPGDPQYREYLGEFYHVRQRKEEAVEAFRGIAQAERRNTRNLARLAEVLAGFGYREQAVEAMGQACSLDPEFNDYIAYAELLREAQQYDASLEQLAKAAGIADNDEQNERVVVEQVLTYQAAERLEDETQKLQEQLANGEDVTGERWRRLALYLEVQRKMPESMAAIAEALKINDRSALTWAVAARIYESAGQLADAVKANRRLAILDRRFQTEYLTQIARLEMRLGRVDASIKAAEELIAAAPGNPQHYQFYADLCFQLGRADEGLKALRRSVRVNPSDEQSLLALARALGREFRTDEAIAFYWRAFEDAAELETQTDIVMRLAELYLRTNQFDQLIRRLETIGKELNRQRDMSICASAAYRAAGDMGSARSELERLLTEDSRDTQLLSQLSQLAEAESDLESAVRYQRRINDLAPSKEGGQRLATLLMRTGQVDEAEAAWLRLVQQERDPEKVHRAIDSLMNFEKNDVALEITDRLLRERPQDWELLFRKAVALWNSEQEEQSAEVFERLVALELDDDEQSAEQKAAEAAKASRGAAATSSRVSAVDTRPAATMRSSSVYRIRAILNLDPNRHYGTSTTHWRPGDYGDARVAALAALYHRAEQEDRKDAFLESHQPGDEATLRQLWDWYHVATMTSEYDKVHEAAQRLAQRKTPETSYLYLASLPNRHRTSTAASSPSPNSQQPDGPPPLTGDEIAFMLDRYHLIKAQKPDWVFASSHPLMYVLDELKRVEKKEQAEAIYREAVDNAATAQRTLAMMSLASRRGDFEALLKLFDRLDSHISGMTYSQAQNMLASAQVVQMIGQLREKERLGDIQAGFDRYIVSRRKLRALRPASFRPNITQQQPYNYVQIYSSGGSTRHVQLSYPPPNDYYDATALSVLRNVYEAYKGADVMSDLVSQLTERAEEASGEEEVFYRLALCYAAWWNDEKDEAAAHMEKAVDALAADVDLRLELATMYEKLGRRDEALALVDEVEPLGHDVMTRRELTAINLAVASGNVDRARQAAERLFGLRLPSNIQLQLAPLMRQLGMHEMAEGVLNRARRRAGSRTSELLTLMQQYQSQKDMGTAVQIAHQILRTTSGTTFQPGRTTSSSAAKQQALRLLSQSGELKDLIARAEEQLQRSPDSLRLLQTLVDYYNAANDKQQAQRVLEKMAELRPEDAAFRYQLAQQFSSSGEHDKAVDNYLAAFRKKPSLFGDGYYQAQQAFRQAKRYDDLVKLLNEIDLSKMGQYYRVVDVCQNLMREDDTREQGMALLKRAWEAFPDQRAYMIGNLYQDAVWKMPEMYDFARQALIPQKGKLPSGSAWGGVDRVMVFHSDGKASGLLTHFMKAAATRNEYEKLTAEVEQAIKETPQWLGGKAVLAVLKAKQGKTEEARKLMQAVLSDKQQPIPGYARWMIGQELEEVADLKDLVVKIYEGGRKDYSQQGMEFAYSPARRLINLYAEMGRKAEARELLFELLSSQDYSQQSMHNPGYGEYQQLQNLSKAGEELIKLGYPVDAFRLYNEALADQNKFTAAARWSSGDYLKRQIESGLKKAQDALTPEALAAALKTWIRPAESLGENEPAIDLAILVQPRTLSEAQVKSLFFEALDAAATKAKPSPQALSAVRGQLETLQKERPADLSLLVAKALLTTYGEDAAARREAFDRLVKAAAAAPLDEIESGKRANARQRVQAARQIPLWLAAHEARRHKELRAHADQLARRAVEAASRQADKTLALAMLREQGLAALNRGERESAEELWTRMLDLVLAN